MGFAEGLGAAGALGRRQGAVRVDGGLELGEERAAAGLGRGGPVGLERPPVVGGDLAGGRASCGGGIGAGHGRHLTRCRPGG